MELNDVVVAALDLLIYTLKVDNIEADCQLTAGLPTLWADPHQLQQVVVNLVSNAHQAMQAMTTPRRLTISTEADADASPRTLTVADTGPGIPHDLQQRIFEPFFTTKPAGLGTGLGLSLCQGIVESHGGTMQGGECPRTRGRVPNRAASRGRTWGCPNPASCQNPDDSLRKERF